MHTVLQGLPRTDSFSALKPMIKILIEAKLPPCFRAKIPYPYPRRTMKTNVRLITFCLMTNLSLTACMQDMGTTGRILPYGSINGEPVARPVPKNTIARGRLNHPLSFDEVETKLTIPLVNRGKERYEIFCAPCHGLAGF